MRGRLFATVFIFGLLFQSPLYAGESSVFDYFAGHFYRSVHPKIVKAYQSYYDKVGHKVGEAVLNAIDYWEPRWTETKERTLDYYRKETPITFRYLSDIPAFVKKSYESSMLTIWKQMTKLQSENFDSLDESKKVSLSFAMAAAKAIDENSSPYHDFANEMVDELRWHTFDFGMQDCYKAVILKDPVLNAFNIGCNVFISEEMIEYLGKDKVLIRAVIAHELAHGDRGHGLKTMMSLAKEGVIHFAKLSMEELYWLATYEMESYFEKTLEEGSMEVILDQFAATAPKIEIDADKVATQILNRAGFSAQSLIDALDKLHGGIDDCDQEVISSGNSRDYPTFCKRKAAIESVMIF